MRESTTVASTTPFAIRISHVRNTHLYAQNLNRESSGAFAFEEPSWKFMVRRSDAIYDDSMHSEERQGGM